MENHFPLIVAVPPERGSGRSSAFGIGLIGFLQRVNRQHYIPGHYLDTKILERPVYARIFARQPVDYVVSETGYSLVVDLLEILRQ